MKKGAIVTYIRMFALAVLSGLAIGVGGSVYLLTENKIVGALMFTVGLYTICTQQFNLFTGKVGYLVENKPSYLFDLLIIWLGNFAGVYLMALCMTLTRAGEGLTKTAQALCEVKMNDGLLSLFILGIFCGMLMFVAVDGYKKTNGNPVILFLCVAGFILCGFEHCIADMFYFSIAGMWSWEALGRILLITLGNSLGGILILLVKKIPEKSAAK